MTGKVLFSTSDPTWTVPEVGTGTGTDTDTGTGTGTGFHVLCDRPLLDGKITAISKSRYYAWKICKI